MVEYEKNIRSIYVYFILICLLCSIIGGGILLFSSAVDYFLPEEPTSTYARNYQEVERNTAITNMFSSLALLAVSVPLFVYHSNIAKNENFKKVKA